MPHKTADTILAQVYKRQLNTKKPHAEHKQKINTKTERVKGGSGCQTW